MGFDFQRGHFRSVGASARFVAFEVCSFGAMNFTPWLAAQAQSPACYVGVRDGRPTIALDPDSEVGSIESEFALWREIARALDGLERLEVGSGRLSGPLDRQLKAYAFHSVDVASAKDVVAVTWHQLDVIPGSPSPHEPHEALVSGSGRLPERLERFVAIQLRCLPGEAFAQAMAKFIATPRAFECTHRALGDELAQILAVECGLTIRR